MIKHKILLMIVFLFTAFINLNATIKVGVYNDKPLIFDDVKGTPRGIYPDILAYIANKEKWDIKYIHGSLSELLDLLKNNKIDLLVSVTPTNERKKYLKFNCETVFLNWATIATRKKDLRIKSIKDLDEKKIAVMQNDSYFDSIKKISKSMGISSEYILYDNYDEVVKSFLNGKSDAGIIPRLFLNFDDKYINSLRNTEIIFSPIELKFATSINSKKHLLQKIDFYLTRMKRNPKSIYYKSIYKWTGSKNITIVQNNNTRICIIFIIIVLILILYIVHIIHHEHKIRPSFSNKAIDYKNKNLYSVKKRKIKKGYCSFHKFR